MASLPDQRFNFRGKVQCFRAFKLIAVAVQLVFLVIKNHIHLVTMINLLTL